MKDNSRKYSYFDPLWDEREEVVFILNDDLLNDLHFPKSFSDEQIIIKMLDEISSTSELQMACI
jgi:uncharacterized protein YozE (UPF0346 family)